MWLDSFELIYTFIEQAPGLYDKIIPKRSSCNVSSRLSNKHEASHWLTKLTAGSL